MKKGQQEPFKMEKQITKTIKLQYLLYIPKGYDKKTKNPLVLFLHGAGERGDDINMVKKWGPPNIVEKGGEFPFLLISPQCPAEMWWDSKIEDLYELVQDIKSRYAIDEDRVYITGLSMGGYGTWEMAISYPDEFAAAIPLCGGVIRKRFLGRIKHLPIWSFHGEKDEVVLPSETVDTVAILKKLGSEVKLTLYPDLGHQIQTTTYDNPEVFKWMLEQKRKK